MSFPVAVISVMCLLRTWICVGAVLACVAHRGYQRSGEDVAGFGIRALLGSDLSKVTWVNLRSHRSEEHVAFALFQAGRTDVLCDVSCVG